MLEDFGIFFLVGMIAQFIDGALGMGYGITASSFLLAAGVSPAHASASVHLAKFPTTAVSGAAHWRYGNINWRWFWTLAILGSVGGVVGAYVLTALPGNVIKPFVIAYLAFMGFVILWRTLKSMVGIKFTLFSIGPVGATGGFLDAIGGGGWGPIVTTTLVGRGGEPRFVIGSVNAAEFVVTLAIGSALIAAYLTGHWEDAGEIVEHAAAIAGLICGGLVTAPIAGRFVSVLPRKALGVAVGILVLSLAAYQAAAMLKLV